MTLLKILIQINWNIVEAEVIENFLMINFLSWMLQMLCYGWCKRSYVNFETSVKAQECILVLDQMNTYLITTESMES